jgi:hypothetical protein
MTLRPKSKPDQKTIEELKMIVLGGEKKQPILRGKINCSRSSKKPQSENIEVGHRINTNQKREIIQKSSETFKTRTAFLKRI